MELTEETDKTYFKQGKLRPWFILSLPITDTSIMMISVVPESG